MNYRYALFILSSVLLLSCKTYFDDGSMPVDVYPVEGNQAINVFYNRATLKAIFGNHIEAEEKGFYFSDKPLTSTNGGEKLVAEGNDSCFTYFVDNLDRDKSYYFKAFIKDKEGQELLGKVLKFTTDRMMIDDPAPPVGEVTVLDAKRLEATIVTESFGDELLTADDKRTTAVSVSAMGLYLWKEGDEITNATIHSIDESLASEIRPNTATVFGLEGLEPDTTYHYQSFIQTQVMRSYATSYTNHIMGSTGSFTMNTVELGAVKAASIRETTTNATLSGKVISFGDDPYAEAGFYYGTNQNNLDNRVEAAEFDGDSTFTVFINELSANTVYYVRPFIKNDKGESTGDIAHFQTMEMGKPIMNLNIMEYDYRVANITTHSARIRGEILSDGGEAIDAYGLYWGTDSLNITREITGTDLDSRTGVFYVDVPELSTGAVYYYRTFAKNGSGESVNEMQEVRTPVSGGKQYILNTNVTAGYPYQRMMEGNTDLYYWELDPIVVGGKAYYFLDRNLGATEAFTQTNFDKPIANQADHWGAIGYHYQFGQARPSSTPGSEEMRVTGNLSSYGWNNSGGPIGQFWTNVICPDGYRMLTRTEMDDLIAAQSDRSLNGFFKLMRLGVSGQRAGGNGGMGANTSVSALWLYDSANAAGTGQGYFLRIDPNDNARTVQGGRYVGYPVRAVRVVSH